MSWNDVGSEKVATLFAEMMRRPPSERETFVREKCGRNKDLYCELVEMLEWEDRMGGFLRDPIIRHIDFDAAERRFQPGQMIANGRFHIVRFVAAGGMGMVYEALDTRHNNKRIAIKCPKAGFGRLLSPELEGALKVRHRNICLVNDTHTDNTDSTEVDFLTMEFLDGETLSERLSRQGRLAIEEALEIARQLCAGVAAAHSSGILHKDLKSSNIILTRNKDGSSRAVITDFGLATEAHLETELEGGTPDYMAPELLQGAPATQQSDIFALGVIFYEMVTGRSPFESDSNQRSSKLSALLAPSRIRTSNLWPEFHDSRILVPPRARLSDLPRRWNNTILRCLESDPRQRFENAESLIAALEGEPLPVTYVLRRAGRAVRRSRETQALLFLALVVAVSWWFYRYYIQMPQIPPGTKVVVAGVVSSEPALSGVTVALKGELQQSAHFEVEADDQVNYVLKQMKKPANTVIESRTAREIALRCGAVLVIFGALSRGPQDYVLAMNVERAKSTPFLPAAAWSKSFHARDQNELRTQVHNAALWVRRVAGESEAEIAQQDRSVEDTTTSSWQALQLLEQANQKHTTDDDNGALLLLDEAIQADPQFAMAHMRKADILIAQKRYTEGYSEWQRAIEITDRTELTSRENLRIKGLYYEDIGEYSAAEKAFHEYALHYPNDFLAWFYWGSALDDLNRPEEALEALKKAVILDPASVSANFQLAEIYLSLRDDANAQLAIQRLVQSNSPEWGTWLSAYLLLAHGDQSQAMQRAEELKVSRAPEWQSRGYLLKANLLSEMGRKHEAITVLRQGLELDRNFDLRMSQVEKLLALAYLSFQVGDTTYGESAALEAVRMDQSPRSLAAAGTLLSRAGYIEDAGAILGNLRSQSQIPKVQLAVDQLAGEIERAQGNHSAALAHFASASQLARTWERGDYLLGGLWAAQKKDQAKGALAAFLAQPLPLTYRTQAWPGIWADTFAQFSASFDWNDKSSCVQAKRYLEYRSTSDPELQDAQFLAFKNFFQRSCLSREGEHYE